MRLIDEGYEVEVRSAHLLLHNVPYVTADRAIRRGTLVCTYIESGGVLQPPDNHQVWWTGEYPCFASGAKLTALENEHTEQELFPGCTIRHRFSNKPEGHLNFEDHYQKMAHYATILSDQARVVDCDADARTGRVIAPADDDSVHRYADTASARAEILGLAPRLKQRVAIIGLGGTGSYILDQLAKTHATEIHLFDGDRFRQHNAFRAPGAATFEDLKACLSKVEYFRARYDHMHRNIRTHDCFIDESTVKELGAFDFVFVCVDRGSARRLICQYLIAQGISFIDVGMSIQKVQEAQTLVGTCRTTLVTRDNHVHVAKFVPFEDGEDDPLYRSNIQIADLNAVNAMLAVIKWKQYSGFYHDDFASHHDTYSISSQSLTRDVMTKAQAE
jgi:molybdopterin/thiamine biosynthesis adenylyltransferase